MLQRTAFSAECYFSVQSWYFLFGMLINLKSNPRAFPLYDYCFLRRHAAATPETFNPPCSTPFHIIVPHN